MAKKSLLETNPYLKDSNAYRDALILNVSSSTAVETAAPVKSIASLLNKAFKLSGKSLKSAG